jgi:hypothetical protein
MSLAIELTPAGGTRLAEAARKAGVEPAELAQRIVADHLPPTQGASGPTLALFGEWKQEDARLTPEEMEQKRQLWEQFDRGINETRDALGMREL